MASVLPMSARAVPACAALAAALALAAAPADAATFADPKFSETVIASNLGPTAMALAPDGRIFVASKSGALRVVKGGQLLPKAFTTLTVPTVSEQGLLGVTLHPRFPDSPFVYVYYTTSTPAAHNRVSRFRAAGDTAQGPEQILFELDNVTANNHMGGALHFGKDGKLYVSSGNSAKSEYGLDMNSTLGKILRLEPDGSIPADNPFLDRTTGKARAVWAAGIRNTFTFAVDPASGRIFGCEVGDGWEEVNELQGGSNYGYGRQEGYTVPNNMTGVVGTFRPASYAYQGGCIIAASFHPSAGTLAFPASFHGKFFFADHRLNWIKVLDPANPRQVSDFATDTQNPVDIRFAADGTMYYLNRGRSGGSLLKVTYAGPTAVEPATLRRPAADARPRPGAFPWPEDGGTPGYRALDGSRLPSLPLQAP